MKAVVIAAHKKDKFSTELNEALLNLQTDRKELIDIKYSTSSVTDMANVSTNYSAVILYK